MKSTFEFLHSLVYRLWHLLRHFSERETQKGLRLAAQRYGVSLLRIHTQALRLYWLDRFLPSESLKSGLLDPTLPSSDYRMHWSEERLHALQIAINTPNAAVCRDKLAFHSYCRDHTLPVADLFGVISPFGSRSQGGTSLSSEAAWADYVLQDIAEISIVKPRDGNQGRDVRRMCKSSGNTVTELRKLEESDEDWLVEECLSVHYDIAELTGTSSVSCVRIITLVSESGVPKIMDAYFRVITGDSVTDNISRFDADGYSGNIVAIPELATGRIARAWRPNSDGIGYHWVEGHPVTHLPLEGFLLPKWDETCRLVERAALCFLPIRTAGWDVAITNDGPKLIEVNERYKSSAFGPATLNLRQALETEKARLQRGGRPSKF